MAGRPPIELTDSDKEFIDNNWMKLFDQEIADILNLKSVHKVRQYYRLNGYTKVFEMTEEQKIFIRTNYATMTEKEIAKELNISTYQVQKFKTSEGLKRFREVIEQQEPEDEFFMVGKRWSWIA